MKLLTEKGAENFLENKGFEVIKRQTIQKEEDMKKIKIKLPWVMKISSKKIVHKAKIGGVIINIKNIRQAKEALKKFKKIKNFEEAIVQPIFPGKEFILGLKKTPEFGIVIMFGKGGSKVEKEKDIAFRILPIKKEQAKNLVNEIKYIKLIKNQINSKKLIETILQLSNLAEKYPQIEELDINPLIVNKKQVKIVDARIVFN